MSGEVIQFSVPLPPVALRANSRAHWATRKRAADEYSRAVYGWFQIGCPVGGYYVETCPWQAARVRYVWRYAGAAPDHSNLGGHTKYLQDCLQVAPRSGGKDRYYLGIVEDDKGIVAEYALEKVARRAAEGVDVRIERIDEHALCKDEWHRCDGGGPGEYERYVRG